MYEVHREINITSPPPFTEANMRSYMAAISTMIETSSLIVVERIYEDMNPTEIHNTEQDMYRAMELIITLAANWLDLYDLKEAEEAGTIQ